MNNHLAAAQQRVVDHSGGPALIIAGPGSGKTHTITHRVARLLDQGVSGRQIVLLTFTKKAAQEMLGRVQQLVGGNAPGVLGGTFHGFARKHVLRHWQQIGLKCAPSVLGDADSREMISLLRKEYIACYKITEEMPKPAQMQQYISTAMISERLMTEVMPQDAHNSLFVEFYQVLFNRYQEQKQDYGVVDFDDLMVFFYQLLRDYPGLRRRYNNQYQHVIVDEFQDTNIIQSKIVELLVESHRNVMVVGDDCQSIYAFRGADVRNIFRFTSTYPEARVYTLVENYRSFAPIVEVVNSLIPKLTHKMEKELVAIDTTAGFPPIVHVCASPSDQAEWIVDTICQQQTAGAAWNDIAVLYRSSYSAVALEPFLRRRKIPYVKHGGVRLGETEHARDLLAFLRVRYNPFDFVAWRRVLGLLKGVGPKTAFKVLAVAEERRASGGDIAQELAQFQGNRTWVPVIQDLGAALTAMNPVDSTAVLFDTAWAFYEPVFRKKFASEQHDMRLNGVANIRSIAALEPNLGEFVTGFLTDTEEDTQDEQGVLTLSTIHSAKGKEWPIVFVMDVYNGVMPSYRADDMDEELRMLYVATSRPKYLLFVSYPLQTIVNGKWKNTTPSPFLEMVPYIGHKGRLV